MNDKETVQKLAEKVLAMEKVCDKSKLDDIELEHIKEVAKLARMVVCDLGVYDQIKVV